MSNFVFDIVITKLNAPNMDIEDCSKLTVVVRFYNKEIHLTASCINVCDFQAGSATEFRAATRKVREVLGACGMSITIYNGDTVEGRAQIYFPINYIQSIEKGMSDLIHTDSVDIVNHSGVVGRIDIQCRLVIKCDNQTPDNNINMQDIMFLVSNSQHCPSSCEPCQDTWEPNDNDVQLDLDLGRYQNVNTDEQKYSNIFINNNNVIEALRPLKKLVEDCKNIIESINLRSHCTGSCFRSRVKNTPFIPAASRSSDSISDNLDDFCRPQPSARLDVHENSQQMKPIRFCPLCLNNMSWLPKFASCPKCGVQPIPVKNEPDDKKGLSADQILNDYMGKPQIISRDMFVDPNEQLVEEDVSQQVQSRCRCSNGNKVCAHCRIRKLCSDIFTPPEVPVAQKPSEQSVKSVDSRPHLVKVFSDLRDLYNVKRAKDRSLHDHQCKVQDNKRNAKNTIPKQEEPSSEEYTKKNSLSNMRTDNKIRRRTTHKGCATQQALVPRRHGWGWPATQEARKYGWKPGAILKPIKKLMDYFLYYLPAENANNILKEQLIAKQESKNLLPILQVCKKGGETRVTLRAGNGGKAEKSSIVFKIVKSDFAVTLNEVKKKLKAQGFRKCTCHKSLMMCVCRSNIEKRKLEGALREECERRGIENCVNDLVLTDTSDSEAEFDINVSPPAKAPQTPTILKRQTVNHATQVTNTHGKVPPRYPIKQSKYWRAYDCAAGGRFMGTAFGAPGEKVFEDGFFGHLGGGPHGATIGRNRFGAGALFKSRRTARESDNLFSQLNHIPYPGAKKQRALEAANKKKIPVKLTKHFKKKLTKLAPIPVNKQIDMMDYLRKHNAFMKVKPGSLIGPDGLTAAQRKRRALLQAPLWPIEFVPRLGSCIDPYAAQCYRNYDQYSQQWCSPWSYYG